MYCTYFGFRFPPFRTSPQAQPFFEGAQRGTIVETLIYGIEHGDGILALTGAPGSGRTTICRVLQARLSGRLPCIRLSEPALGRHRAMHALAGILGVGGRGTANDLDAVVRAQLRANAKVGRHLVILIDEAQHMPLDTLESLRLLAGADAGTGKTAQLVLVGTPYLDVRLAQNEARQIRSRITYRGRLAPLAPGEVNEYLGLRLRAAGDVSTGLLPAGIGRYIARVSGGLPVQIDRIADRTLMAAFAEDTREVTLRHARTAARRLNMAPAGFLARVRCLLPQRPSATPAPSAPR